MVNTSVWESHNKKPHRIWWQKIPDEFKPVTVLPPPQKYICRCTRSHILKSERKMAHFVLNLPFWISLTWIILIMLYWQWKMSSHFHQKGTKVTWMIGEHLFSSNRFSFQVPFSPAIDWSQPLLFLPCGAKYGGTAHWPKYYCTTMHVQLKVAHMVTALASRQECNSHSISTDTLCKKLCQGCVTDCNSI